MKITDTISVNPSKTALGHVEAPAANPSIFRSRVLGTETHSSSVNFLSLFFPTSKSGASEYKKYDVPLRTLFSTILIVTGISCFTASAISVNPAIAICSLCFGVFLALGLLTRPVMLGAAAFYCIFGALSIRHGEADISMFSLMFGCVLFAVLGSGKYSCDSLIRKAIVRHNKKQKNTDPGYKAFHKVKF